MARIRAFHEASFVYFEGVVEKKSGWSKHLAGGEYKVYPGETFDIVVYGISPDIRPDSHGYRVQCDKNMLHVLDHEEFGLGYRFDRIDIPFRVDAKRPNVSRLRIAPHSGVVGCEIDIGIRVRERPLRRLFSFVAPGMAAATAASAGILPDTAPVWVRLGVLSAGSIGVAVVSGRQGRS